VKPSRKLFVPLLGGSLLALSSASGQTLPDPLTGTVALDVSGGPVTYSGNSTVSGATISFTSDGSGTRQAILPGSLTGTGTLLVNGSLGDSAVTVDPLAAIGGSGPLGGDLSFASNSFLRVVDFTNPLAVAGTVTFGSGFGIANLLGINWDDLDLNTPYTVISTTQTFGAGDIANFGIASAVAVGDTGRQAFFTDGSLAVVVIPEPAAEQLGCLGMLLLLRRHRP